MHVAPHAAYAAARRLAIATLSCTLVFLGCSDDEPSGTAAPKAPSPATITSPPADEQLTKDMGSEGDALTEAGCELGRFTPETEKHVKASKLSFKSFPPTSGTHFDEWAAFGVYDEPLPDGNLVHNLEHGGVVAWLGTGVDDDTAAAVADIPKDGEKWIIAPREDITGLYAGAWGAGLTCSTEALGELGTPKVVAGLEKWYDVVNSTGSEIEKDVPAYAGSLKDPKPIRGISEPAPF